MTNQIDQFIEKERAYYYQFVKEQREFQKSFLLEELSKNKIEVLDQMVFWFNGDEYHPIGRLEEIIQEEHKHALEGNYGTVSIEYLIIYKYMQFISNKEEVVVK